MTEAAIPLAGVIGSPVAHSLSPRLHRHWLRRYALPGHYIPMDVAQDDVAEALQTLPKLGFKGVNVTIPHKVTVLALSDLVSDRAALIGAANTLTFQKDGKIVADNTDGYGFLTALREGAPAWDPAAGPAAVLGAGGAARAVLTALLGAGVPSVRLTNRTRARAELAPRHTNQPASAERLSYSALRVPSETRRTCRRFRSRRRTAGSP